MTAATLSLVGVTRRFGAPQATLAVDALTLDVPEGELLALIGASGSGKTTTLRIIAGHEMPDEGRVLLDGRDITAVPPRQRGFGMVFQHYALFPHMTVGENVAFPLRRHTDWPDEKIRSVAILKCIGATSGRSSPGTK